MTDTSSEDLTRGEQMAIWAAEALFEVLPPSLAMAWAWKLDGKRLAAEAKASKGEASEAEIGAAALTQTFLDELRSTVTG